MLRTTLRTIGWTLAVVALALHGVAAAQKKKSVDDVRAMLASATASERAHGAAIAAKYKMKELTAPLLDVIKKVTPGDPAGWFAADAAFDALIRSEATVFAPADGEKLAKLPERFLHPAIILLARTPGRHLNALTKVIDRGGLARRKTAIPAIAASCRLLSARKTPGLPTYVFSRLFDRRVHVWVTDGRTKPPAHPKVDWLPPHQPRAVPDDFPSIGYYRLIAQKGSKRLVAKGKPNIGFVRVVVKPGKAPTFPDARGPTLRADDVAVDTIATLLGSRPKKIAKMLPRHVVVRYRSDEQVAAEVKKAETKAAAGFEKLFAQLKKAKLLRPDQAAKFAKPEVARHDLRAKG